MVVKLWYNAEKVKKMKNIFFILLLLNLITPAPAQLMVPVIQYQLLWDNDVFMTTDHYYTQGLGFRMYDPFLSNNPVNLILLKTGGYDRIVHGLSVLQQTYTPKDIRSDEIQYNDRPYAGVLLVTSGVTSSTLDKKRIYHSELDLGVMGPASGAGKVQYYYHDITDNPLPNGWHYQQYNWPVINYNFTAFQQIHSTNLFEAFAKGRLRAGTLHDDANMGLLVRFGKMDSYMQSLGVNVSSISSKWRYYIEAEPSMRFVAYNATLQGGWYRNRNIHYIPFNDLSYAVPNFRAGVTAIYQVFGLKFDLNYTGKEFKEGTHHWFHNITLFLSF